jgi:hypothetical protein
MSWREEWITVRCILPRSSFIRENYERSKPMLSAEVDPGLSGEREMPVAHGFAGTHDSVEEG